MKPEELRYVSYSGSRQPRRRQRPVKGECVSGGVSFWCLLFRLKGVDVVDVWDGKGG